MDGRQEAGCFCQRKSRKMTVLAPVDTFARPCYSGYLKTQRFLSSVFSSRNEMCTSKVGTRILTATTSREAPKCTSDSGEQAHSRFQRTDYGPVLAAVVAQPGEGLLRTI